MKLNWLRSVIPLLFSCVACDSKSLYNLSIQQLKDLVKSKDLQVIKNVLKYEGAFAVTNLSTEYSEALKDLKLNSPDCLHSLREILETQIQIFLSCLYVTICYASLVLFWDQGDWAFLLNNEMFLNRLD